MNILAPKPKKGATPEGIQWAYRLVSREASGEHLPMVSRQAWREVLGYAHDVDARAVLEALLKQPAAA